MGLFTWLRGEKQVDIDPFPGEIPPIPQYKPVEPPQGKLYYVTTPPYVEPTDKEMIEGLYESERPAEAYRLQELKKENAVLKGKLTKLKKKYDGTQQS